jgi:hypothetical protein
MAQEDKLKREIDLIGKLLAKLLSDLTDLKSSSGTDETIQSIQQSFKDHLSLDLNVLLKASPEGFRKLLNEKNLNDQHLQQIADILYQLAERNGSAAGNHNLYEKALLLYEELSSRDTSYSLDRHFKIEKIRKLI